MKLKYELTIETVKFLQSVLGQVTVKGEEGAKVLLDAIEEMRTPTNADEVAVFMEKQKATAEEAVG